MILYSAAYSFTKNLGNSLSCQTCPSDSDQFVQVSNVYEFVILILQKAQVVFLLVNPQNQMQALPPEEYTTMCESEP